MPDYKVTVEGSEPIPVSAKNRDAARNHAVRQRVSVEPLTTADAMAFGAKGVPLQVAGEEALEPDVDDKDKVKAPGAGGDQGQQEQQQS